MFTSGNACYLSVQTFLSYRCSETFLPFVVHGRDIWCPVLRQEPTTTVSRIKFVGGYLGIKRRK